MSKTLCKFRRAEIIGQIHQIQQLVDQPQFLCKSCARVANQASFLCKPAELAKEVQPKTSCKTSEGFVCPVLENQHKERSGKRDKKIKKLLKKQKKIAKKYQKLLKK